MYTIIKKTYEENNYNFSSKENLIPVLFEYKEDAEEKILSMAQGEMIREDSSYATYTDYMEDGFHVYAEYQVMRLENC